MKMGTEYTKHWRLFSARSVVQTDVQIFFWGARTIGHDRKTEQKCSRIMQNGRKGPSILQHLLLFLIGLQSFPIVLTPRKAI